MQIKPFFVVFPVLVGVVIYAYYAPEEKPERATTLSPKQYIELVEKKKKEKQEESKRQSAQNQSEQDSQDNTKPK